MRARKGSGKDPSPRSPPPHPATSPHPPGPVHVHNSFDLHVRLPLRRATALFGPLAEANWAGRHWTPEFLHPRPGEDVEGAVFTTQHGPQKTVWVTTKLDVANGTVQYVSIVPGKVASIIDVRLAQVGPDSTRVKVTYNRTALDTSANEEVRALGQRDAESGPHWQAAIQTILGEPPR